jgi:hypothetical protein
MQIPNEKISLSQTNLKGMGKTQQITLQNYISEQ